MSKTKKIKQTYLEYFDKSSDSHLKKKSRTGSKSIPNSTLKSKSKSMPKSKSKSTDKKLYNNNPIVCDKIIDSTFYTSDRVKLSYQHCIDTEYNIHKPNIVLLHGVGFDSNYWIYFFNKFYSVSNIFALDFINCGRSDYVNNKTRLSLTKLLQDLVEFLDHNKLSKIYLVGHGLGGIVALYFASIYPNKVIKIAIASTSPKYYSDADWTYEISPQLQKLTSQLWGKWDESNTDIRSNVKEELRQIVILSKNITKLIDPINCNHKHLTKQLINTINNQKIYSQTSFSADARLILEHIQSPVLIMTGTSDPTVPIGASLYLHEKIKYSKLIEFHGHGSNFPILDIDMYHNHIFDYFFIGIDKDYPILSDVTTNQPLSQFDISPLHDNNINSSCASCASCTSCASCANCINCKNQNILPYLTDNNYNNCLISVSNNEKIFLGNRIHIITDRIYSLPNDGHQCLPNVQNNSQQSVCDSHSDPPSSLQPPSLSTSIQESPQNISQNFSQNVSQNVSHNVSHIIIPCRYTK